MRPYVYKTIDYGKTWTSVIPKDTKVRGYAHVVKEDLVNRDLLFAGTEFGLWVSVDGGKQWAQYKGGDLPSVAVRDLAIHPRDADLVIATHGRGIWIIDDITPLRKLTPDTLSKEAEFIQGNPVVQRIPAGGGWVDGDAEFTGPNPPDSAVITFYQKKRHIFGDMKLEVFDAQGNLVSTIPSSKRRGLNRVLWSMRMKAPRVPTAASAAFGAQVGPRILPGAYTVKLTKDKNVYTMPLQVVGDPRANYPARDRKAQFDLMMKLYHALEDMTFATDRINGVRTALEDRASKLPPNDPLANRLRNAAKQVDELRRRIVATKEGGAITGEQRLREYLTELYGNVSGYEGRPSQTQTDRSDAIAHELGDVVKDFDAWTARELGGINSALRQKGLEPIAVLTRAGWDKKE
jgi:hypothetical protein